MTRSDADARRATFEAQLARAQEVMQRNGLRGRVVNPPLHRLLWACGVRVPPPLFCGFALNATLIGTFTASVFLILAATFEVLSIANRLGWGYLVFVAMSVGLGVAQAWTLRRMAREHGLPSWEDLARPEMPDEEQLADG